MKKFLFSLAGVSLLAAPAWSRDDRPVFVTSGYVPDKPTVAFDSSQAYVMLRSDTQMPLLLMKVPTAEDQAAYDRLRAEAFAEARTKYLKKKADYDRAVRASAKTGYAVPEKPVEPTEANFEFTAFGMMALVSLGPLNRFAKGDGGASTYLQQLTPGEYRIYGPVLYGAQGVMAGTCFCMGSVKFEARAGEITDLGVILAKATAAKPTQGDSSSPIPITIPDYLGPAPASMPLDPRLAQFKVQRAVYRPVGKLPNYFGITIGRIPEMAGVMRYDRDRIVDLTAAN